MTQLIVEIEDPSVVANIKKAISMLRGVSKVHVKKIQFLMSKRAKPFMKLKLETL